MYATIVWSVVWWFLYPSWPGITGYFARDRSAPTSGSSWMRAWPRRAPRRRSISSGSPQRPLEEIAADPELTSFAFAGGGAAFADNCAPCHGLGGAGQGSYPRLADDDWLWGGTLDDIHTTLLYGIRSDHADTRFNVMPAFGCDGILDRQQINDVAEHVLALSGRQHDAERPSAAPRSSPSNAPRATARLAKACRSWAPPTSTMRSGCMAAARNRSSHQIYRPRHGVMPAWTGRLDPETVKTLSVYVHGLGGGQ